MIPRAELLMRRRIVREFIRVDYARVSLVRPGAKTKTAAGAWTQGTPTTLSPQLVRLIPAKRRYNSALVNTEAGDIEKWPYSMIGAWNLDVAEGDTFTHNGQGYKVMTIEPDREERTLVALDFFGEHTTPVTP